MYYTKIETHICEILLVGDENGITNLYWINNEEKRKFDIEKEFIRNDDFFGNAIKQIHEFFLGKRKSFDLKLNPKGTEFQKKVWRALAEIPFAETVKYKDIAMQIGNKNASRAVGMANNKNPIPLIVPCHRVIGFDGKLVGYAGGLDIKRELLDFEKMIKIYNSLFQKYGEQNWWPADSDFEMMIGAVLTQNTTWENVEKALANLKNNMEPKRMLSMPERELAKAIRPSGYYNQKAIKLKSITKWFGKYDYDIHKAMENNGENLREELLSIHGIGRETADCILTYALKKPFFIIDTYTRRVLHRIGFQVPDGYDDFRKMIESAIGKNLSIYNEYHALIVEHGKKFCLKVPKCGGCPLYNICEKNIK